VLFEWTQQTKWLTEWGFIFLHTGQNVFTYFSYRHGLNTQRKSELCCQDIYGSWCGHNKLAIFVLYIFLDA